MRNWGVVVLFALICAAAGLVPRVGLAGEGASLAGTWSLVEQRYGEGQHDFAEAEGEIRVLLEGGAEGPRGSVVWENGRAPWPAYPTPDGPAPVKVSHRSAATDLSWVEAKYVVPAPEPGETHLHVRERWELAAPDRARCTVTIAFERDGQRRGQFTWHRVFEREEGP